MKKVLSLILALAMVLALAACGGGNNDGQQSAGESGRAKCRERV